MQADIYRLCVLVPEVAPDFHPISFFFLELVVRVL